MTEQKQMTAADWGQRDGLVSWLQSVAWTSGPEAYAIPEEHVDAVGALFRCKVEAIAVALIARRADEEAELERLRSATRQVAALADEWDRFGLTGAAQRLRNILGEVTS